MLTTNQLMWPRSLYSFIYKLFTSVLLFGLVYELLSPWYHSSAWGLIFIPQLLTLCTVSILGWGILFRSFIFQWLGYITIVVTILYFNFADAPMSYLTWLTQLPLMYGESFELLWLNGIFHIDDFMRISCLLLGWTILMMSFQQLIWQFYAASSLLIIVLTYLVTLHILFGLNIYDELIKVVLYGSLLMALTFYMKRNQAFSMLYNGDVKPNHAKQGDKTTRRTNRWYFSCSLACLLLLLMMPTILLSFSKEKNVELAQWTTVLTNRLINNMSALSTQVSGQPLSRQSTFQSKLTSGYSAQDNELGSSIDIKEGPVFEAWSEQAVYWRGEAKTTYTGKGWTDDTRYLTLHKPQAEDDVMLAWSSQHGLRGELINQEVKWLEPVAQMPLFHGGINATITDIYAISPERKLTNYIEDEWTSNLYAPTESAVISSYQVMAELPITDETILEEIEPLESELAEYVWQHEGLEQYLQLPEQLPVRVTALANEIAGGGLTSRYDQVKAIEQYLKSNYTYSTKSERPGSGQDFVDQFLFEQQKGYCVHFATSMVVLLRAQEIPARYVKGYLPGDVIDERLNEHGYMEKLYEVGHEDAHAWVEVYFPGAGWVPFDPTPAGEETVSESAFWQSLQNNIYKLNASNELSSLRSFVQMNGTYLLFGLAALLFAVIMAKTVKLIGRSSLAAYLQYAKSYKQTIGLIEQITALQNMQQQSKAQHQLSRAQSKQQNKVDELQLSLNKARKRQQRQFGVLVSVLESMLNKQIHKLERKANINGSDYVTSPLTYRKRIEKCAPFYGQPTIDLLLSLCVWIEVIHYSEYKIEEIVHLLPLPKQLSVFSRHIRVDLSLSE